MKTIKLSKPSRDVVYAVERERYEIMREVSRMMFTDGITWAEVAMLAKVVEMIRSREES
jgi:hypothetical protein